MVRVANRLIVFSGLPGTGKSAVANALGRDLGLPVLSVDPIECALSRYLYPELLREFAAGGPMPLFEYYARHRGSTPGALISLGS